MKKAEFLTGTKLRVLLHIAVWITLFLLPTYLLYSQSDWDSNLLFRTYIQTIFFALVFYLNYLFLIPFLFFRDNKVLYFIAAMTLILFITPLQGRIHLFPQRGMYRDRALEFPVPPPDGRPQSPEENPPPPPRGMPTYNFMLICFLVSGFAMGLRFYDMHELHEKRRKEAEKEKLNSELAFLKNQINPHFFFNTLNNIYSLVQTKVEVGQKAILQLSRLMRYLLYETEKGDTLLSQEIDFMKNYIELMKLRLSQKVTINIVFPEHFQDVSIPPLLFLPFIENAFKHGISYRNPSFIRVLLNVGKEEISFECCNSKGGRGEELFKSDPGIGLENVRKRLALLYPGNHKLQISDTETTFDVVLKIGIMQNLNT